MKVAYEFELGIISRDSEGNIQDREPLHFLPKSKIEVDSLIDDIKENLKENIEFDLDLIKWTTNYDWEFGANREDIKIYPKRSDAVIPKYIEKIISRVLSELDKYYS